MRLSNILSKKSFWPGIIIVLLIALGTLALYSPVYPIILITSILMYIVLTVSWTIFSGPTGYISLAPAAFFGAGIYTAAFLGKALPLPLVIIIAGALTVVLALLVGALTLRLKGIYFAIFTFGLVELIKNVILWYEINFTGTRGRFVVVVDNTTIYYIMLIIFIALMITAFLIKRSKWGLALQSIGDYEEAAAHSGINVTLVKIITFAISAIFMGAAGAIMATRWTYIDPYIAFNASAYSFLPVLMAIFGGSARLYGPVLGGAIFGYLEELLLTRYPSYFMLIFGIILVGAIVYLPNGLVGLVQNWRKRGSLRLWISKNESA
jgi:branched-chain amino acid transport system permease protein